MADAPDGASDVASMKAAGFNDTEIGNYVAGQSKQLGEAGFSDDEIKQHFGQPPVDPKPMQALAAQYAPRESGNIFDAVSAGWQGSASGLMERGERPEVTLAANAPWYQRIAASTAGLAGDAPFMAIGALGGAAAAAPSGAAAGGAVGAGVGAVVGAPTGPGELATVPVGAAAGAAIGGVSAAALGAGAGANALPAAVRSTLMDYYANGQIKDFGDFATRFGGILWDTTKAAAVGAVTAGVGGKVAEVAAPIAAPAIVKTGAQLASEAAAYVTTSRLLEGQIPTAQDWEDSALMIGGLHAAVHLAPKLRDIYAKTGKTPADIVNDSQRDVLLSQDVAADNVPIPAQYQPLAEAEAPKGEAGVAPASEQPTSKTDTGATADATQAAGNGQPLAVDADGKPVDMNDDAALMVANQKGPIRFPDQELKDGVPVPAETDTLPAGTGPEGVDVKTEGEAAQENKPEPGSLEEAQQKVLSKIDVGGEVDRPKSTFNDLYTAAVDDLSPIKQAVEAATKGGEDLATAKDPYELARLTRGAAGRADHFLQYGTYDFKTYENNGPGLKDILAPVNDDLDGFRAYAAASRAVELGERGIESGIDQDAAKQVIAAGAGKFEEPFRQFVGYQDKVTQYLRDSGVLSNDAYAAMTAANKNYVPFFRVMDDGSTGGSGASGRSLRARNTVKGIKGSDKTIVDPIESAIKNTYTMTAMAERNAVAQAFENMPNSSQFIEKVVEPARPTTVGEDELKKFLEANGIKGAPDDLLTVFRSSTQPLRDNEIRVFKDGRPTTYKTDPDIARAFKGMDPQSAGLFAKMLALPASLLRAGSVLTPDFALRHVFRDYIYSFVTHKGDTPADVFTPLDMAKGLAGLLSKDKDYQAWLKGGGANISMVSMDRRYLQANLDKLTEETGLGNRVWNLVKNPLDAMRVTVELAENMSHLGAFKKALDVPAAQANREQILDAGFTSRATAVDTARIGAKTRAWNMISAFANVTIQDSDRIVRAFKDNPVGTTAKVASAIVLPSALLWYANHDDPRYQQIPEWEKDLFWIITTDKWEAADPNKTAGLPEYMVRQNNGQTEVNNGHIFRISKPFGAGVLFGSGTERMLSALVDKDPHAFHGLDKSIADTLIPSAVPSALSPVVDQYANKSLFTGSNLIPDRLEKIMPEYQYNPNTSETAKALGKILGAFPGMERTAIAADHPMLGGVARALTTPILIENYLRGWTGGLGMYALQISDKALTAAGLVPDAVKPASTLADIPVVKSFVVRYPSASAQSIQDFYDRYAEKQVVWNTIQTKAKEGDPAAVMQAMHYDPSAVTRLDGMKSALSQQGQLIQNINKNPDISPSDKRQLIDTTYYRMIEVAKFADKTLDQIDAQFQGKSVGQVGTGAAPQATTPWQAAAPFRHTPASMPDMGAIGAAPKSGNVGSIGVQ